MNEKVKAVPFVPKVTITFLRLPRSINFYSGKERGKKKGERNKNHNIIMKLEKKKKKERREAELEVAGDGEEQQRALKRYLRVET